MSPINIRSFLRAPEQCGNYIVSGTVALATSELSDFWQLARAAKEGLTPFQSNASVINTCDGLTQIMHKNMTVASGADLANSAFGRDVMISNLGVVPFGTHFGHLKLESVFGPAVIQGLQGEQMIGVATANESLSMLHVSYSPIENLLQDVEVILTEACAE
jgi:NRPS condensation-like uncharacterized protein